MNNNSYNNPGMKNAYDSRVSLNDDNKSFTYHEEQWFINIVILKSI